jgi:Ca-activated chloride channel family protein
MWLKLALVLLLSAWSGLAMAQTAPPQPESEPIEIEEAPSADGFLTPLLDEAGDRCFRDVTMTKPELPGQKPQSAPQPPQIRRLILAIDSSGSMRARAGGERKIDAALSAARNFLQGAPQDVEVGLVLFGHKGSSQKEGKAVSCAGVDATFQPGEQNRAAVLAALSELQPVGWTPLASAIEAAGRSLQPSETAGEQVVYVVSDGVETCGGDPVGAARQLHQSGVKAVVNVIGFDLPGKEREQLRAVAESGGGIFLEARTAADLQQRLNRDILHNQIRATRAQLATSIAQTRASIATSTAINRAQICMGNLMSGEQIRVSNALSRQLMDRSIDRAFADEVRAILTKRHDKMREAMNDYRDALTRGNQQFLAETEAELKRALAVPGKSQ